MQTRYDYMLHATVPSSEDWGVREPLPLPGPLDLKSLKNLFYQARTAATSDRAALHDLKRVNRQLARAEWEARSPRCESLPGVVQVSQTEVCNLLCKYCRPTKPTDLKTLSSDRCLPLLHNLLPTAHEFLPYCWGEPLLSPDFVKMCELAARYAADVSIITNLHHLTSEHADAFARYVTRAQVSVDTADPVVFAAARRGGDLRRLEDNLAALRRAGDPHRRQPWLGVSAVLTRSSMAGVPELIQWASGHGFRGVCVRRVVIRESLPHFRSVEEIDLLSSEYLNLLDDCRSLTAKLGLVLNMPDPFRGRRAVPACRCLWDHVYVSASGAVNMCVFSHRQPWGSLPLVAEHWNAGEIVSRRARWADDTRCEECSSLDFLERVEVSQVRGY